MYASLVVSKRTATMAVATIYLSLSACSDGTGARGATGMRFVSQPQSVVAGQPFSVSVELLDAGDRRFQRDGDTITIVSETGIPLSGGTFAVMASGLATFNNLSVTKAAGAVRLIAASPNLSAISTPFAVTAAAPALQNSSVSPLTPVTTGVARTLTFTLADAFGNRVASRPIALSSNLAGVALSPGSGVTTPSGTFVTSLNATLPGSAALSAMVDGTAIMFPSFLVQLPCTPADIAFPQVITGALPTESCSIEGVSTLPYRFITSSVGAVTFAFSGGFPATLNVTPESPVETLVVSGGTSQTAEWLLPPGTWLLRVGAPTGSGDFTLSANTGPGKQGAVVRNIAVGGSFEQSLGAGDFTFPDIFGDDSFWDVFRMRASGSCTISAQASVPGLDLLIVVTDEAGEPFTGDDNSGGGTNPQIVLDPCEIADGPVRVLVNHYLETPGGPYTLTVSFGPSTAGRGAALRLPLLSWSRFRRQLPPDKHRFDPR